MIPGFTVRALQLMKKLIVAFIDGALLFWLSRSENNDRNLQSSRSPTFIGSSGLRGKGNAP